MDVIENDGILNHLSVALSVVRRDFKKKTAKPADVLFETTVHNGELLLGCK